MKSTLRKIIAYILQIESRLVIFKYQPKIIAITGSVGKTSTKDAVYAVLSGVTYVRKSEKSFNSEIGLPLTILGLPNGWNNLSAWLTNIWRGAWLFLWPHKYPKWLVLEVGVGKPGDMERTASWLKTDAVIITAIGKTPAHIEFFNSRKHLIEEKNKLIKTLRQDGILILNADDSDVLAMKTNSKHRSITFGFSQECNLIASGDNILYDESGADNAAEIPKGIIFRVDEEGKSLPVVIEGVFGRNHVYASLAALALVSELKFNMLDAINLLKDYEISPGRMRLIKGIKDTLIIDDTYNSSPFACESALLTLGEIKCSCRKIAILGDMLELGRHTEEAHRSIGEIAKRYVQILIVVGARAKAIKEGALEAGMAASDIYEFDNSDEAAGFIKTFIQTGDLLLVKGSQGMRMERIVEAIMKDKRNKKKLLVRQDEEWKRKK